MTMAMIRRYALCLTLLALSCHQSLALRNFLRNEEYDALGSLFSLATDSGGHSPLMPPLTRRDPRRCTEEDPCAVCEGDCSSDNECGEGLICYERERGANMTVPGCSGGEDDPSRTDYCVRSVSTPPSITYVRQCNETNPCGHCEGDCDSDKDCEGDLECFQREEDDRALVPGCMGGGDDPARTDFCYKPPPKDPAVEIVGQCTEDEKCGLCQGDCDDDTECSGDLKCFHRDKDERAEVPGCSGGDRSPSRTDYCYKSCGCCIHTNGGCYEYESGWAEEDCVVGEACPSVLEAELECGTCDSCTSGISCLDKYGAYNGCPIREYGGNVAF